jgi:outer membrane receptor for ferrienterochelin and colicins
MKSFLYFLFISLFYIYANSQSLKVISSEEGKYAIEQAKVIVKHQLETEIFFTNRLGIIEMNHKHFVEIKVSVSAFGYLSIKDTIIYLESESTRIELTLNPISKELTNTVITGQYEPVSEIKSMHKIRVINREKIDNMAAQNLKDVLTNEMNIRLSQDNTLGSSLSIQGLSGQNVKILMDGVPINGRLNGNIDLSQINLNNIERIEIIEGPLSVQYGTDALAGTINLITKKNISGKFGIKSNSYYESSGNFNQSISSGFNFLGFNAFINGGRNYFDGWKTIDPTFFYDFNPIADTSRFKDWKPREQYFARAAINKKTNKTFFSFATDFFDEKIINRGLPREPYLVTALDDYYYTQRIANNITYTRNLKRNSKISTILAYNYFNRISYTKFKDLVTLQERIVDGEGENDTSRFDNITIRSVYTNKIEKYQLDYEIGTDINTETAFGKRIENNKQFLGDYAFFSTFSFSGIKNFDIKPGIRYAFNTTYVPPVIPSLHLKYSKLIKENSNLVLRGSYAKGFRAPTLKELHFYFVDINHNIQGNPNLEAEKSDNFSLGVIYMKANKKVTYKTELSAFYNDINNLITLAQKTNTEFSYFNINTFITKGLNLQTDIYYKKIKANLGIAYIGRYNRLSEFYDVEKFLFTPEFRTNIMYKFNKSKTEISLFYKYNGAIEVFSLIDNSDIISSKIQGFNIADITLQHKISNTVNITIGSKNIFNIKNINGVAIGGTHSSGGNTVPMGMGRTYFLGLNLDINKKNEK